MIQLYKAENTNYSMNGDYTLSPFSCFFECKLNDIWTVTIDNPPDDLVNESIANAVLCVPTPYGKRQLFRIYEYEKTDDGITASAYPIFLDSRNDCFLWDVRPTNKNGQDALNTMLTNSKYSASSDIKKLSTAYYVQKNFIEALNGDDENAFLKRWGGEVAYNNFEIIVNEKLGQDNGLRAEFGFNLLGVSESVNMEEVVTSIVPKSYNGHILPNNETVDSPLINNYPVVYTRVIEYNDIKLAEDAQEDDEENGITVCDNLTQLYEALRERAQQEYENEIDKPKITYSINMVDLSKTELYKDYKDLLTVNLGDTVHIKNRKLNIVTTARVIELTYDCIGEKVESLVLGDYEANYFNDVSSITDSASKVIDTSNNTLMGEKIQGIINLLNTSLRAQKNIAQKQDVRAILFEDLDASSPTFGALCIGTQGIQISKKRNATNTDWVWGTAINFESIVADYIITGILTDQTGKFYLNLQTGELRMRDADLEGKVTSNSGEIGGFDITESGFIKRVTTKLRKKYTSEDAERIRNIIVGNITATSDDYYYYDVNGNGQIDAADYYVINDILVKINSDTLITEVRINPKPFTVYEKNSTFRDDAITVTYQGASGTTAYKSVIGARDFNAYIGTFDRVSCNVVDAEESVYAGKTIIVTSPNGMTNGTITATDNSGIMIGNLRIERLETYTNDGNYLGCLRRYSASNGAVGIGLEADQGDNIFFGVNNVIYMIISGGGSFSHRFNMYGDMNMNGFSIDNTSDIRKKKNIRDIDTRFIYDLAVKEFDYIDGNSNVIGIIANDYEDKDYSKLFTKKDQDGFYTVNYQQLHNALIKCVQEQKKEIDDLKKEVEQLKNLIKKVVA